MSRQKVHSEIATERVLNTSKQSINTENSDHYHIQLPFFARHCIFCVSEIPAKFIVQNEKVTRVKNEKESSVIERQVKSILIAQKILGVKQKTCHELLTQFDGQLSPELWLNVCFKCNGFVEIYCNCLTEIVRLAKKADHMRSKLKQAIWESIQSNSEKDDDDVFSGVWKDIRTKALCDFDPSKIHQLQKSTVKIEQDDLTCMISLILIFIILAENSGSSHSDMELAAHSSPFQNTRSCSSFIQKLPKQKMNSVHHNFHTSSKSNPKALTKFRRRLKEKAEGCAQPGESGTGEKDHFSEECHFGDIVVNSDVGDDEAFVLPTSPFHAPDESSASTSQFFEVTASNLTDDGEEVEGNLALESVVEPPSKKRKTSQTVPNMGGKQTRRLQCGNRQHRSRKVKLMNAHVSLDEEGTQGVPCDNNDFLVQPRAERHIGEDKSGTDEAQSTIGGSANNPADHNSGDENEEDDEVEVDLPDLQRPKRQKASQLEVTAYLVKKRKGITRYECSSCPYRTTRKKEMYAHVLLHKKGSQAIQCQDCGYYLAPDQVAGHRFYHHVPKKTANEITNTARPSPVLLNCPQCPHKTTETSAYKRHQKVHHEGFGSAACNECGIFVLPNRFVMHQIYCTHAIRKSLGKDEKPSGTGRKKFEMHNASNSDFICFKRSPYKNWQYGCRHCSYETIQLWRMKVHVELHDESSQAELCGECGWFLPPGQMETHRAVNHSVEEGISKNPPAGAVLIEAHIHQESNPSVEPGSSVKKSLVRFRCANCPYECKRKEQLDGHLALHSGDSTAIPCPACDIFYRPGFYSQSHNCGKRKWKMLKARRLKKAELALE